MRLNFLLAVVVATFAATCITVTNAENVAQISGVTFPEAEPAQLIGGDNQIRRLKGDHHAKKEWWKKEDNNEERGLSGMSFLERLRGRADKVTKLRNGVATTEKLSNTQVKELTAATANAVKKDRRIWPYVKKFLIILYGSTVAALVYVGVTSMFE
ncbi:putative secreted RxLR effector peptide protein [Phytophthora cinnamomi]|uniref:putative secreted RxLR effector peptide protein n=1 Tax=Phytophthora cinnamomi TaxID=4785 RepID=UPI00355A94F3|nr:putative secreted RxLR effector peptide protein [Phytophthora cinnamomi]